MNDTIGAMIMQQNAELEAAKHHFEVSETNRKTAFNALSNAQKIADKIAEIALDQNIQNLPKCDVPLTDHRMKHRPGRPSKIDQDPELEAFLMARIGRLTFVEMAKDVAQNFPKDRHVGKSTIHKWYKRRSQRK